MQWMTRSRYLATQYHREHVSFFNCPYCLITLNFLVCNCHLLMSLFETIGLKIILKDPATLALSCTWLEWLTVTISTILYIRLSRFNLQNVDTQSDYDLQKLVIFIYLLVDGCSHFVVVNNNYTDSTLFVQSRLGIRNGAAR